MRKDLAQRFHQLGLIQAERREQDFPGNGKGLKIGFE